MRSLAIGALFLATRATLCLPAPYMPDTVLYFEYARRFAAGLRPYADVPVEYPPLALALFSLPMALVPAAACRPDVPAAQLERYFATYRAGFVSEMLLLDVLGFAALAWVCGCARLGAAPLIAYTVFGALLQPLVYDRFDLALGVLLLAAIAPAAGGRLARAASLLATCAGFLLTLVPILLLPLLVLMPRRAAPLWRRIGEAVLWFAVPGAAVTAIAAAVWGSALFGFVGYHRERGIQIESTWSSVALLGKWFGQSFGIDDAYGAQHLTGGATRVMRALSLPVMAVAWIASTLLVLAAWHRQRDRDHRAMVAADACTGCVAVLLAFLICSKVLSPQFMLWLVPLVPVCCPRDLRARNWLWLVFGLVLLLTSWIFRYRYWDLVAFRTGAVILLLARNALLVGAWVLIVRSVLRRAPEASH
ncbi:MAG: hypothetical protein U1E76_21210 [Planctomycetota bacterium]